LRAFQTISDLGTRLYAIIIGINDYPKLNPLRGAVADADDMALFLTSDLGVPSDHIVNLRNDAASRKEIIRAFRALQKDPRIKQGDPILIFYAGHGGLDYASEGWKAMHGTNEVQVIFPFDYGVEVPGSSGPVNCIPDKTIAALLNELAAAKGNNIVSITTASDTPYLDMSSDCHL
jgi:hypothetical protein